MPRSAAFEQLAHVRTFELLHAVTLTGVRELTGAEGATLVVMDGDNCFYVAEDAVSPLWAGQRFLPSVCISGWAMVNSQQTIVHDIEQDERIPLDAYRPTFVRSLVMTPTPPNRPAGALGAYWSYTNPVVADEVLAELTELADSVGAALDRLGMHNAPWAPNFELRNSRRSVRP